MFLRVSFPVTPLIFFSASLSVYITFCLRQFWACSYQSTSSVSSSPSFPLSPVPQFCLNYGNWPSNSVCLIHKRIPVPVKPATVYFLFLTPVSIIPPPLPRKRILRWLLKYQCAISQSLPKILAAYIGNLFDISVFFALLLKKLEIIILSFSPLFNLLFLIFDFLIIPFIYLFLFYYLSASSFSSRFFSFSFPYPLFSLFFYPLTPHLYHYSLLSLCPLHPPTILTALFSFSVLLLLFLFNILNTLLTPRSPLQPSPLLLHFLSPLCFSSPSTTFSSSTSVSTLSLKGC